MEELFSNASDNIGLELNIVMDSRYATPLAILFGLVGYRLFRRWRNGTIHHKKTPEEQKQELYAKLEVTKQNFYKTLENISLTLTNFKISMLSLGISIMNIGISFGISILDMGIWCVNIPINFIRFLTGC